MALLSSESVSVPPGQPSRISLERLSKTIRALEHLAQGAAPAPPLDSEVIHALQQEAEALRSLVGALTVHLREEALLAAMSSRLRNLPLDEVEAGVMVALAELGKISTVQRAYVFLLADDGSHLADGYEWVAEGVAGHDFTRIRGTPVTALSWSMERLLRGEIIVVDDPAALPPEAGGEHAACEALGTRAYVNLPQFAASRLVGWLGFDSVGTHKRWTQEELRFMTMAGDILINALQRKRREALLARQRELHQQAAAMSILAAGLAHEIQHPLSVVVGELSYLRELLDTCHGVRHRPELEQLRLVIHHARAGADRVHRMIGDLRALVLGEQTEIGDVDLAATIDATLRMTCNQLRQRARVLHEYDGVPLVKANASQLGQVLLHLLINAAHAIPESRAAESTITLSAYGAGDVVHLEVKDTGCGIAPEILPRVFEPFFTTRNPGEGMGLGLAICRHIIESIGGSIDISSQVGQGTTVLVTLPRARMAGAAQTAEPPARELAPVPAKRILLVDDEPLVVSWLARVLREHDLVQVCSGREAMARIDATPDFELVFYDVMMSDLTGEEVYRHLRERHPGMEQRLVFLGGGAVSQAMSQFLGSVPNVELARPFDSTVILALVGKLVS